MPGRAIPQMESTETSGDGFASGFDNRFSQGLGQSHLLQRRERIAPTGVRYDGQLKDCDRRKVDVMVFRLGVCAVGTEVPLLPHDIPERLSAIWRPTQDVLLR
nr:hypothetical protein [Nitrospirales bacterium]